MNVLRSLGALAAAAVLLVLVGASPEATTDSYLIAGARIADGSGAPLVQADVRVAGDRISEVGKLAPRDGERVVRGDGLVLAPGFIDVHNHSADGLKTDPLAETQISQGITTLVVGPDGDSPWPIAGFLAEREAAPAAVNVMTMVGHETVRSLVLGKDFRRKATADEIAKMAALVDQGMKEGAAGLSSGLEYDVGSYASTDELVELSKAAARFGGFYMTHSRDEADKSFEAMAEAIEISDRGGLPLDISHIKLATVGVWGRAKEAVALIERARSKGQDVTADCYPYEAWHSNIEVLVPNKQYFDAPSVERALADVGGPSRVTITACKAHPAYANRNLEEIAKAEGITPVALFARIVKDGGADVIGHSMKTEDVEIFYRQPWVMVASDGGIDADHPRGAGTFPRVLGRFVRDRHLFTLEEAVRKMTSLPASRMKLSDRGRIAPGMKADLVLFNPLTVIDRSTFEDPRRLSEGIDLVVVNGEAVWSGGKATGAKSGRVLRGRGKA
ncbi:MAG TPA: D-aminoacylase [Thermoanaerobaculia bacterium]|jgi:N-acyl-D-amino-acid deacylase|nr:D-aminoacylase [Thermoanaerobaculia bacterium]